MLGVRDGFYACHGCPRDRDADLGFLRAARYRPRDPVSVQSSDGGEEARPGVAALIGHLDKLSVP